MDFGFIHKVLKGAICFVVQALKESFETKGFQKCDDNLESGNDKVVGVVVHQFSMDAITIVCVDDQDALIVGDTWCNETTRGVSLDHT
jgi:hypothetical protein